MRPIEIYQSQSSTRLAQPGKSKYQRPQSSAVNLADVLEIQYYIDLAGLMQCREPAAKIQIAVAQSERAFQIENHDALALPLLNVQTHGLPRCGSLAANDGLRCGIFRLRSGRNSAPRF